MTIEETRTKRVRVAALLALALTCTAGVPGCDLFRSGSHGSAGTVDPDPTPDSGTLPDPDVTPPAVTITSPADGALVARKQRIEATATDNVRVSRVDFSVDGVLLASDTSAPYLATWNTRRASSGPHIIEATAYDPSGNSATARITVWRQ